MLRVAGGSAPCGDTTAHSVAQYPVTRQHWRGQPEELPLAGEAQRRAYKLFLHRAGVPIIMNLPFGHRIGCHRPLLLVIRSQNFAISVGKGMIDLTTAGKSRRLTTVCRESNLSGVSKESHYDERLLKMKSLQTTEPYHNYFHERRFRRKSKNII